MARSFTENLNEIANDLVAAFDLSYEEVGPDNLKDPLLRWLDYRARYIEPRARRVLKAPGFDAKLPTDAAAGLDAFIALAQAGSNLNPFQTKTTKRNDTSGKKPQRRTDHLWADWGIFHAHLTEVPLASGAEFSERSDWLLFFFPLRDELLLIDVRAHDEPWVFQSMEIVETLIRSWPELAERWQVKGVAGLAQPSVGDAASVKALREAGITRILEIDGKVYGPPGMGVTTAATSTRVSLNRNQVIRLGREIERAVSSQDSPFVRAAQAAGIAAPTFELRADTNGNLALLAGNGVISIERNFPEGDARYQLYELFLPEWAGQRLVRWHAAKDDGSTS